MDLLTALRIFGPVNRWALVVKLGRTPEDITDEIYDHLKPAGLVAYDLSTGTWSVTELGRRMVDRHEVEVSAMWWDKAWACVRTA